MIHHIVIPLPTKLSYDDVEETLYLNGILDCLLTHVNGKIELDFMRQGDDTHTTTQNILDDLRKAGLQ